MMTALLAAVLAQAYYTPAEAQALFSQANEAYSREDYRAAEEGYQKLIEHGFGGPDVLFNLGTTYLADGKVGESVLALERAQRTGGRAPDVEANLALARAKQLDQVVGGQAESPFIQRLVDATSAAVVGWVFLVSWNLGFALLALYRVLAPGRRAWAGALAALLVVAAAPAGLLVLSHVYVGETITEAVVMEKTLKARELPKESGKISFEVHEGLKVRLLESSGKFVKIRLPNGLEGWTEREGVVEI